MDLADGHDSYDDNAAPLDSHSGAYSVGASTKSVSRSLPRPDLMGGGTARTTSETRAACNEETEKHSDILSVFDWGFNEVLPGGSFL
jgi:hypothetical protein